MRTEPLAKTVQTILKKILLENLAVTRLACQQRAKFEGWLKFELAVALAQQTGFQKIILEDGYNISGRSDISFERNGVKWYIEMKTANTNWRAEGLEKITRPVTRNMDGVSEDIRILRIKATHGLAVFCIFPIPSRLWKNTREQLDYHLRRIEETSGLEDGILLQNAQYVEISQEFGVCTFAIEVV